MENKLSHVQLEEHIEEALHTNLYEHRENIFKFLTNVTLYALLGAIAGGLTEKAISKIQNGHNSRQECAFFLVLHLIFISLLFYILIRVKFKIIFDSWMMDTFAGFMFALTFFAAQNIIAQNISCILQ